MTTLLRPGNRCIRAVVRPAFNGSLSVRRTWPCSNCGTRFDAHLTSAVLYSRPDQAVPYAFMVCPGCAARLTPLRLRLDRRRLDTATGSPQAGDATDRVVRAVTDHLTSVLAMRTGSPGGVVRLRAHDTHLLAGRLGRSPAELVRNLQPTGVLVGVDVASQAVAARAPAA